MSEFKTPSRPDLGGFFGGGRDEEEAPRGHDGRLVHMPEIVEEAQKLHTAGELFLSSAAGGHEEGGHHGSVDPLAMAQAFATANTNIDGNMKWVERAGAAGAQGLYDYALPEKVKQVDELTGNNLNGLTKLSVEAPIVAVDALATGNVAPMARLSESITGGDYGQVVAGLGHIGDPIGDRMYDWLGPKQDLEVNEMLGQVQHTQKRLAAKQVRDRAATQTWAAEHHVGERAQGAARRAGDLFTGLF